MRVQCSARASKILAHEIGVLHFYFWHICWKAIRGEKPAERKGMQEIMRRIEIWTYRAREHEMRCR
jgi:hypothetical protein